MAEENQETKLPQEQPNESSTIPPTGVDIGMQAGRIGAGPPKMTWPETVGLTAEEAERMIKEEMPRARIQVVPPDSFVTMDYNQGRVRLYVDSSGKIARPPRIG